MLNEYYKCNKIYLYNKNKKAVKDFLTAVEYNATFEVRFKYCGYVDNMIFRDCGEMSAKKFNEILEAMMYLQVQDSIWHL